jgi:ADP-heptose:LPS heptosyltransferase
MAHKPILILQMHRMGDLILSFPLLLWLQREYPGHPLWVVGEPRFYKALLPISPEAVYLPWTATGRLRSELFFLCINLSHEAAAAALAGQVNAEKLLGAVEISGRGRYVFGNWQLYRTGLVQANRHNCFHWADLNALDCIPLKRITKTRWSAPRTKLGDRRRVGLFLGASEETKRPAPSFWAALARELLHRDLRPILLGGPGEKGLATKVQQLLGQKILNLAGRLNLAQFADFGQSLELMVTPDTGPMHLAAWTGLRVLNLSMGPVNPWETGPYQPGHFVLQARMSCVGCWQCSQDAHRCHGRFLPRRIAQLTHVLATDADAGKRVPLDRRLGMFVTSRSAHGLLHLETIFRTDSPPRARELLNRFWSQFWGFLFGLWNRKNAESVWKELTQAYPLLAEAFVQAVMNFRRKTTQAWDPLFWSHGPPFVRPLFSHTHLVLQNSDFSDAGKRQVLKTVEELLLIVAQK